MLLKNSSDCPFPFDINSPIIKNQIKQRKTKIQVDSTHTVIYRSKQLCMFSDGKLLHVQAFTQLMRSLQSLFRQDFQHMSELYQLPGVRNLDTCRHTDTFCDMIFNLASMSGECRIRI